jgi:S1-C subfamily serine protease
VVRSKGRDVSAGGVTRFNETGSGVLVSSDGRVMTAAHVVNGMDQITVGGIGGEVVRVTIISASAGADVSLLQLERVTKAISARWPPNTIFPSATCWPAWRRAPRSR